MTPGNGRAMRIALSLGVVVAGLSVVIAAAASVFDPGRTTTQRAVALRSQSTATQLPEGATSGNATTEIVLRNGQAHLDPPSSGTPPPSLGAADAWKAYTSAPIFPQCSGADLDIRFGLYTDNVAATRQPDGGYAADYAGVPEWLVHCRGVSITPSGPGSLDTPKEPVALDAYEIVDPTTGKILVGFTEDAS